MTSVGAIHKHSNSKQLFEWCTTNYMLALLFMTANFDIVILVSIEREKTITPDTWWEHYGMDDASFPVAIFRNRSNTSTNASSNGEDL